MIERKETPLPAGGSSHWEENGALRVRGREVGEKDPLVKRVLVGSWDATKAFVKGQSPEAHGHRILEIIDNKIVPKLSEKQQQWVEEHAEGIRDAAMLAGAGVTTAEIVGAVALSTWLVNKLRGPSIPLPMPNAIATGKGSPLPEGMSFRRARDLRSVARSAAREAAKGAKLTHRELSTLAATLTTFFLAVDGDPELSAVVRESRNPDPKVRNRAIENLQKSFMDSYQYTEKTAGRSPDDRQARRLFRVWNRRNRRGMAHLSETHPHRHTVAIEPRPANPLSEAATHYFFGEEGIPIVSNTRLLDEVNQPVREQLNRRTQTMQSLRQAYRDRFGANSPGESRFLGTMRTLFDQWEDPTARERVQNAFQKTLASRQGFRVSESGLGNEIFEAYDRAASRFGWHGASPGEAARIWQQWEDLGYRGIGELADYLRQPYVTSVPIEPLSHESIVDNLLTRDTKRRVDETRSIVTNQMKKARIWEDRRQKKLDRLWDDLLNVPQQSEIREKHIKRQIRRRIRSIIRPRKAGNERRLPVKQQETKSVRHQQPFNEIQQGPMGQESILFENPLFRLSRLSPERLQNVFRAVIVAAEPDTQMVDWLRQFQLQLAEEKLTPEDRDMRMRSFARRMLDRARVSLTKQQRLDMLQAWENSGFAFLPKDAESLGKYLAQHIGRIPKEPPDVIVTGRLDLESLRKRVGQVTSDESGEGASDEGNHVLTLTESPLPSKLPPPPMIKIKKSRRPRVRAAWERGHEKEMDVLRSQESESFFADLQPRKPVKVHLRPIAEQARASIQKVRVRFQTKPEKPSRFVPRLTPEARKRRFDLIRERGAADRAAKVVNSTAGEALPDTVAELKKVYDRLMRARASEVGREARNVFYRPHPDGRFQNIVDGAYTVQGDTLRIPTPEMIQLVEQGYRLVQGISRERELSPEQQLHVQELAARMVNQPTSFPLQPILGRSSRWWDPKMGRAISTKP